MINIDTLARKGVADISIPMELGELLTQDKLDIAAAEFAITNAVRKYGSARYDRSKEVLLDLIIAEVDKVRERAIDSQVTATHAIHTQNFHITLRANAPAKKVDVTKLITELLKAGIAREVITACTERATVEAAPALYINVDYTGVA
jgi:hypothetical protein